MAEHNVTFSLLYDGTYHPAPVRSKSGASYLRGTRSAGADTEPAEGKLTLDNDDGRYAPRSPLSSLHGKIGQNTTCQLSVDASVRMTAEVTEWNPDRNENGTDRWTELELGGVLRRLGRGTDPLQPALVRASLASGPVDYWPVDDGKTATSAGNAVSGGAALTVPPAVAAPAFAGFDAGLVPDGLAALPLFGGGALAAVVRATDVTSWRLEFVFAADPSISGDRKIVQWRTPTGGITDWWVETDNNSTVVSATSAWTGSTTVFAATLDSSGTPAALANGAVHHVVLDVSQTNSTTLHYEAYVDGVLTDSGNNVAAVGRPQCGPPTTVTLNPEFDPAILTVGSVGFWSPHPAAAVPYAAVGGYVGELAAVRFGRLCGELAIPSTVVGTSAETAVMGPQTTATPIDQLDEIARTDDARIFETRASSGLTMRTGASMLNQDPVLTVSYIGQIKPRSARPVVGDAGIRNDVTARSPDGSTGRYVQQAGPRNVQLPAADPQGVGRYSTTWDVNPGTDAQLVDAAGWRVNLGTYDGTWYASVTVDLDAAPGLTAVVNTVDIGDVVAISELPVEESLAVVDGLVIGIEEQLPEKRRLVTFYLVPAAPYRVGQIAAETGDTDPLVGYVDPDSAVTAAAVASGAASFTVTASPLWTTVADDFPQDVVMAGQRVSISAVAGAAAPQTFTVQPLGRQVVYPISVGETVLPYQPLILAP